MFPGHSIARASAVLSRPLAFGTFCLRWPETNRWDVFHKGHCFLLKIREVGKKRGVRAWVVDVDDILIFMMYCIYFIFTKVCSSFQTRTICFVNFVGNRLNEI